MTYILAIDPGVSTGIVLGRYTVTEPWERTAFWQVEGGVHGFNDWWRGRPGYLTMYRTGELEVVSEKFTPIHHDNYALTQESVEPLRVEGAIITHLGRDPIWQQPAEQYFAGGDTLPQKKKLARAWLKERGLLVTGSQVDLADGNDVNSATLHAMNRMKNQYHLPTLEAYFK